MRLHGQDIVLVLRAVRQRHIQHAAHIRILRYAIARSDLHTGDLRVVCVESGEINVIAQSAAVQLCKQHALANRFSGGADHGACLRSVLVPCQHRAKVKLRFRQVFICFAGVSGFFALVALVGIRVRADGGVGQDFLLGLRLRLLLRLGVLPLLRLVFRFLRIGLLLLAGQLAVGAAARTGSILAFRLTVSSMARRLPCLQDGDFLRCSVQDWIFRLSRPHAHERQADTQQQRADKHAAAGLLQPWEPFKSLLHSFLPFGKRASPLPKFAPMCGLSVYSKDVLKYTDKPHGSTPKNGVEPPSLGWLVINFSVQYAHFVKSVLQ